MEYWGYIERIWKVFTEELNATNWIAISAAIISVLSVVQNNRLAYKRDSLKSRREEFNKQITASVEEALKEFRALSDKLLELADNPTSIDATKVDELFAIASKAQRSFSRAIRKASASPLCKRKDWASLGQQQYDDLVDQIDSLRSVNTADKIATAIGASNSIEGIIDDANIILYREIAKFI